jgi:hypothetical protein
MRVMGWGLITAAFNMVGLLEVSRREVGGISAAGIAGPLRQREVRVPGGDRQRPLIFLGRNI